MSAPKPIGFDNWKAHFFISKDGSGNKFWIKASFSAEVGAKHRLFRGPSIATTTAATNCVVTTDEAHGFHDGQLIRLHGMPGTLAALLNTEHVITWISTTSFSVPVDTSLEPATTGVGIAGVDIGTEIPTADAVMTPGRLCIEDYPDAWEMPFEG